MKMRHKHNVIINGVVMERVRTRLTLLQRKKRAKRNRAAKVARKTNRN